MSIQSRCIELLLHRTSTNVSHLIGLPEQPFLNSKQLLRIARAKRWGASFGHIDFRCRGPFELLRSFPGQRRVSVHAVDNLEKLWLKFFFIAMPKRT